MLASDLLKSGRVSSQVASYIVLSLIFVVKTTPWCLTNTDQ